MKKIIAVIIIFLLAVSQLVVTNTNHSSQFHNRDLPLIIAHGGGKTNNPENTMRAFDWAYEVGSDVLEGDVQLTKDYQLVLFHDEVINDLTEGSGRVFDYTFEELQIFDAGVNFQPKDSSYVRQKQTIPLLSELFAKYKSEMLFVIELKNEGDLGRRAAKELYKLIEMYNLEEKIIVASFNKDTLHYFREITDGKIMTSAYYDEATNFVLQSFSLRDPFISDNFQGLQLPISEKKFGLNINLTNRYLLFRAKKNNVFIHYWTVNEENEMRRLIELGVDGIITDEPELLANILKEYK